MPGFLNHLGATVICAHGGQAIATVPNPRVMVSSQPTLTVSCVHSVAGCGLTPSGSPFCVTAQWLMGAMRVTSGGQPLLLQDSQSLCTPTGTPLTVVMTQVRVQGT